MFSYYGTKTNIINLYPPPKFNKIIEPFAGAAKYSLKYFENDILLVDKYEDLIKIWLWLQKCSKNDILTLPRLRAGQNLKDFTWDCEEQKKFMGFMIGYGLYMPNNIVSSGNIRRPNRIDYNLKQVASNLFKIRHWTIKHANYDKLPNQCATWFIDPPYEFGGHKYIHGNKNIDFNKLAKWCKSRTGQTIVCENTRAKWLDFEPMVSQQTMKGVTHEAIWSNLETEFKRTKQLQLF